MGDIGIAAPPIESDSWCRTTSEEKARRTFIWTVEEFLSRPEKNREYISSSHFTVSGPNDQVTTWRIHMFPKGDYSSHFVSLFIESTEKKIIKANFCFSILNEKGQKVKSFNFPTESYVRVSESGQDIVGGDCILIEELKDNPDLLPSGNLIIVCDLTVYGPEVIISGSKFPKNEKLALVDNSMKQMCEQVGKLFSENKFSDGWGNSQIGKFSDVQITCGEEVFHCHRSILSVRSPVFEAMFESDMLEKNSRSAEIKDIKPDVVKEMLHFIYNGATSTENLMDEIMKNLLGAAEQYQLNLLKNKCEEKLCSILEVSNSVELLVLADLHQAPKLRKMAMMLVTSNMDEIVNTDVYKELNAQHPTLTLEITKAVVQKARSRLRKCVLPLQ